MTDVIGTGDIDADPVRIRRAGRWRRTTWAVVATVAIGALVVPVIRSRLADESAGWLTEQWAQVSAYDDARAVVIGAVERRAGALDDRLVETAVRFADREEAAALIHLAREMRGRAAWAGDVDRARDAAVAALETEVAALNRDAHAPHPAAGYLADERTDAAMRKASARILSMARRHHRKPPATNAARTLAPDRDALARLARPTDFATGLSLVVSDAVPQIVDLDTGHATILRLPSDDAELRAWAGHLLVSSRNGTRAITADGQTGTVFTRSFAQVLSSSGSTLWLNGRAGVRRFAADGHPLTPWIRRPSYFSPETAVGTEIVITTVQADELVGDLWNPVTGRQQRLPSSCYGGWAAAGRTVVPLPCEADAAVSVIDASTGTTREIRLPGRLSDSALEAFNPLSPDGHRLAVIVEQSGQQAGVFDLRSHRFLQPPIDASLGAVGWSPDGQWVLLADSGSFGTGRPPRLALWRPRDGRMTSVRLPPGTTLMPGAQLLGPGPF